MYLFPLRLNLSPHPMMVGRFDPHSKVTSLPWTHRHSITIPDSLPQAPMPGSHTLATLCILLCHRHQARLRHHREQAVEYHILPRPHLPSIVGLQQLSTGLQASQSDRPWLKIHREQIDRDQGACILSIDREFAILAPFEGECNSLKQSRSHRSRLITPFNNKTFDLRPRLPTHHNKAKGMCSSSPSK